MRLGAGPFTAPAHSFFMSVFMSDFDSADRSTDAELEHRINDALEGLKRGLKSATIVRQLSTQYGVSPRQARRYVRAARCEMYDAPDTYCELFELLQENIDHLSLMADQALAAGDAKTSIQASKACALVIDKRLQSLQRQEQFREQMSKRFGE